MKLFELLALEDWTPNFTDEEKKRKYRRLVVRWERQKNNFDAFLSLATIHIWVNRILLVG